MRNVYFVGKAGSGKSYCAKYLSLTYGYIPVKFANPVYYIAEHLLGMRGKDRKLLQTIGTTVGREGVEERIWVKRFCEDMFMAQKTAEILNIELPPRVVDDCRYPNEQRALKRMGWVGIYLDCPDDLRSIRLGRRDGVVDEGDLKHDSEQVVDLLVGDVVHIDASGTLSEMFKNLEAILDSEVKE